MPDFSDFAAVERDGWSDPSVARSYAEVFAEASLRCVPATISAVGAAPGMRALDLCCGPGLVAAGLVRAGADVVGADFSPAMLDIAREAVPTAEFIQGDAADLPFAGASFDAVTIGFGIPHVSDPAAVMAEARRVLHPGGRLALSVWLGPEDSLTFRTVFGAIAAHAAPGTGLPPGPDANALAYEANARPVLERLGFSGFRRDVVDAHWITDSPDAPFHIFSGGTVRGGTVIARQTPETAEAMRQQIMAGVIAEVGETGPWRIPIPAAIISAAA